MPASSTRGKIVLLRSRLTIVLVVVPILILLLLLNLVLPRLRERGFRAYFDNFRKIANEQFTIYLEADDPAGDEVERILKQFLDHLYDKWGGPDRLDLLAPAELEAPVVLLLLKDKERLRRYHGPRYRDQTIEFNAGMYEPIAGTISLISSRFSGPHELRRGLYHETTHMVLDRLVRGRDHDWSLWLNEGLATYLEASIEVPGVGFDLGELTPRHIRKVKEEEPIAIGDILALKPKDFTTEGNSRAYAIASVFVGFLLEGEGGKYRRRFWQYVAEERAPGPVGRGAFERVFEGPVERLAPAFQRFATERLFH
jgi:hypothetical protein